MIRVTVDLIPSTGGPDENLGVGYIANDGYGTKTRGAYNAVLWHKGREWRRGSVPQFLRQKFNSWDLLCLCLVSCLGDKRIVESMGRKLKDGGPGHREGEDGGEGSE